MLETKYHWQYIVKIFIYLYLYKYFHIFSADFHHPWPDVPSRGPIHEGSGDGLPRRVHDHRDADPPDGAPRGRVTVPYRAGGDRYRLRAPVPTHEGPGVRGARADYTACV